MRTPIPKPPHEQFGCSSHDSILAPPVDVIEPRHRHGGKRIVLLLQTATVVAVLSALLANRTARAQQVFHLVDVTASTGIQFIHDDGHCGDYYIVETMSAGVALFDYDNDGDIDIYFLNGAAQCEAARERVGQNALYRNEGNWRFTDVTRQANVGHPGHGLGVAVGDYNNDGWQDVYLNNFGPNVLYRNMGDGTFADVTSSTGLSNGSRVGGGASFLDFDADGDLDLYVANYVKFSRRNHVSRTKEGYPNLRQPCRLSAGFRCPISQ